MEFGSGKKRSSNLFDYMVPQTFKSCEKGEIYLNRISIALSYTLHRSV